MPAAGDKATEVVETMLKLHKDLPKAKPLFRELVS
jgi:hypothetical protein